MRLGQLPDRLGLLPGFVQFAGQGISLLLDIGEGLCHGQLACYLAGLQLSLEPLDFRLSFGPLLLQLRAQLGTRQFHSVPFVAFGQLQSLVQLMLEVAVAHLFEDVGVAGFIDLEGLAAVRANDVVHGLNPRQIG